MRISFDLPQTATQVPGEVISCEHLNEPSQRIGVFSIIRAELGRALAAERRYETLRFGRARQENITPSDIPRAIFEEFYAVPTDSEHEGMNQASRERQGHASPLLFTLRRRIGKIKGLVFGRGA